MIAALLALGALAVLAPFGIYAATAILNRPQWGVLALAFALPFDGLLLLAPLPGIFEAWKEGLIVVIAIATFSRPALPAPAGRDRSPNVAIPGWFIPLGAFVLLVLVSGALGVVAGVPGVVSAIKIGVFYLVLPVILWWAPLDAVERDRLITGLMLGGAATALIGIGQQVVGAQFLHDIGYEWNSTIRFAGGFLRSFSTFTSPFPFAFYLSTVLLVCVPVALANRTRPRNQWFLIATPILLVGMATAVVRGAFVAVVIGVVFLAIYRYRLLVHLIPLGVAGLLLLPTRISAAFFSTSSLVERFTIWGRLLSDVETAPLGAGVGAIRSRSGQGPRNASEILETVPSFFPKVGAFSGDRGLVDNHWLKVLVELGPIGLWLFACVIGGIYLAGIRIAASSTSSNDASLASGVAALALGSSGAALFATYWEIFPADMLFWLFAGLLASITRRPDRDIEVASEVAAGGIRTEQRKVGHGLPRGLGRT